MPNLAAVEAIASNTPSRTVVLSGMTTTVLFTCLDAANRLYDWQGAGFDLTPAEIDEIEAILSDARHELMGSQLGEVRAFASAIVPNGCLLCDGGSYLRVDYPDLYAVLAPAYIVDADNFIVPDLRDRFILGAPTSPAIGTQGGEATHTLTIDEMPTHTHIDTGHAHSITLNQSFPTQEGVGVGRLLEVFPLIEFTGTASANLTDTGGSEAHNNMPPFETLAYYIVAR